MLIRPILLLAAAVAVIEAGPVEFGRAELDRAIEERGLNPRALRIKTEVAVDPPDSYRIAPGLITGGDLRGLMYGLLEAAAQIRAAGKLRKAAGEPALAVRGVRMSLDQLDAGARDWRGLFEHLARNRFNRFNLVLPWPCGDTDALRLISEAAAEYGVDFTLSLRGDANAEIEAALGKVLSACPSIRNVQLRLGEEAAAHAIRALGDAGRRVTLEAEAEAAAVSRAAVAAGLPVRIAAAYTEGAAAPLTRPFFWEIPPQSLSDARAIRAVISKLIATGASGFEIEMPEAGAAVEPLWGRLGYDPK
ncbi:MAG: hypothetical protein ACM336_05640 [Acidobacteriota bacterium]